jgi:hypothetical protein
MSVPKPSKVVRRSVANALGIICIILIGGLGGAMLYTVTLLNDKDKQIASFVTVDEIAINASEWLNRRVVVEGKLLGPLVHIPERNPPYGFRLFRYNETSEASTVFVGLSWNGSNLSYDLTNVLVIGVVVGFDTVGYFIEAESVFLLK